MPSLKREEAVVRHDLLTVESYDVDLDLTRGDEVFGSSTTIRFSCRTPGSSTFVEIDPRTLVSVTLNGESLDVDGLGDGRFHLDNLAASNELVVQADMAYAHDGEGLHRFTDPEDGLTYTYMMGFLDMASRVFACFEQPDLKAPYRLTVTAPEDWTVTANEAGTRLGGGRWEFVETKPLATYFVTVVAGPYHSLYREHDGVRFGLHSRRSFSDTLDRDADELFEVTFGCWDRLNALYGVRYPFGETYDQCFVPEFNAGAMENPGCVTFRDERFLHRSAQTEATRENTAATIAHEMAHMWFGDLVTMRWWDDLWLNESFADCMGYRAATEGTRYGDAKANAVNSRQRAYEADEQPSTHPVSGDVAESGAALSNFDAISYDKGGAVLEQLAAALGDKVFFSGLREYFEKFRFGNASLSDLMDCFSNASGRDLSEWSQRWLRTAGPNTLRVDCEVEAGRYRRVEIEQTAPAGNPTLRPHHVRLGLYRKDGERLVLASRVAVDVSGERTVVPQLEGTEAADLLLLNDDAVAYAKVRLDADSFAAVPSALLTVEDSVARAIVWTMLIDMVRCAELSVPDYLDILGRTLSGEKRTAPLQQQLAFARTAVNCYLPVSGREAGAAKLREITRSVRQRAEPGSGIQLAALRSEIGAAVDVEWLRGLLLERETVEGRALDSDLRWRLLLRLAVLGEVHDSDIDAELERDSSSEGFKNAATCRAALPSLEAKETAWETVLTDQTLSNHLLRATAEGFWWPEQEELTRDYVGRFFGEASSKLSARAPWEQMHLARALFPRYAVDEETIALAETTAGEDRLHAILRRVIVDMGSDLRLARRVRGGRLGSRRG
ncbi:aminopeptidase N [Stackebrandtia nassauensis]|uniref:Aminopeptidase N n=1 Tax=Stackebrandtia nassauensis (strain DSM 44728 / CIP 108903 / NRRL B-16338 / NBRC 102104 / LLR-40K-21) TaxID=446470 RepID=D3PVY7_STANL|nr:aminopeptidase N [Stackebrandtia nassauensis]ADD45108.1 aminopeptidase N [Stackebrandtia nassauensis DSM 44728]